jgi:protein gp37
MNRIKKTIGYAGYSWNPVTGCLHGCGYCYARRIAERFGGVTPPTPENGDPNHVRGQWDPPHFPYGFAPTFYPQRLDEPLKLKTPAVIFVCDMADLFGRWVPRWWIHNVLHVVNEAKQHQFLFLTKYPERYAEVYEDLPANGWYGTTVTKQEDLGRLGYLPLHLHRWASFEPLLGPIDFAWRPYRVAIPALDWAVIGAQTGPGSRPCDREWVNTLARDLHCRSIPVWIKDNVPSDCVQMRERPKELSL